jgi:hypothetical protein
MKIQTIAAIVIFTAATSFADDKGDKPAYQNPLDKPARNVRDNNPVPVKTSGYQNPLESPAYNRTRTSEEKWLQRQGDVALPTATAIARANDSVVSQQNADARNRQRTLQAEASALRTREEILSKQVTKYPSMTNEQKYEYDKQQTAIRNLRIAKEYELKELQRIEQDAQRKP